MNLKLRHISIIISITIVIAEIIGKKFFGLSISANEIMLTGIFTAAISILLGIEDIRILITSVFNIRLFPEEIYFLSQMPSEINLSYIIIISFFSLLVTFLATIFPSLAAAKLDPIKALKYE